MSNPGISKTIRRKIAEQSRYRCGYCQSQEEYVGMQFTIDHIIPQSLGGLTIPENLCLACWDCNLIKHNRIAAIDPQTARLVSLFHPNEQKWREHFAWHKNGLLIVGKTDVGRATVQALKLNRPILLTSRRRWIEAGWHPPQD